MAEKKEIALKIPIPVGQENRGSPQRTSETRQLKARNADKEGVSLPVSRLPDELLAFIMKPAQSEY